MQTLTLLIQTSKDIDSRNLDFGRFLHAFQSKNYYTKLANLNPITYIQNPENKETAKKLNEKAKINEQ